MVAGYKPIKRELIVKLGLELTLSHHGLPPLSWEATAAHIDLITYQIFKREFGNSPKP
jgi:hypothetical protein